MHTVLRSPIFFLFCLLVGCFLSACTTETMPASTVELLESPPHQTPTSYDDILLQNYTYSQGKMIFNPQNIRLGGQSPLDAARPTARTRKGTHLHLFVNQQHHLSNENIFDYALEDGEYDLFAFIARSYYESIKVPNAIMGRRIKVKNGNLTASRPIEQIALIPSAPVGTHTISATDSLLFDFVLYGTTLSAQGNYVTLEINQQAPMKIDTWQPYYLTGFSEGEQIIRLTLNNAAGKAIAAAVDYSFTVEHPKPIVK